MYFPLISENGYYTQNVGMQDVNETVQALLQATAATTLQPPPPPQRPMDELSHIVNRFGKLNPPIFKSLTNPMAAKNWMRPTERVFTLMTYSETQKMTCASYMFKENAG